MEIKLNFIDNNKMASNEDKVDELCSKLENLKLDKFKNGEEAREKWSKTIDKSHLICTIEEFNKECDNCFEEVAKVVLDPSNDRQSTLNVEILNKSQWDIKQQVIYIITFNNYIIKIGGTRNGMKQRWSSYLCGYYVPQRKKKNGKKYIGKMSVTNAYVYHTIENELLKDDKNEWKIYIWQLPSSNFKITILGEEEEIASQTFHVYESCCIKKFKKITKKIPLLSNNCDPNYR
jgi:hypothetical protein